MYVRGCEGARARVDHRDLVLDEKREMQAASRLPNVNGQQVCLPGPRRLKGPGGRAV